MEQGLPLRFSVSCTSRPPRGQEQDGVEYYFITEEEFRNYLYAPNLPDPDLLIRTGGEMRISNFLLWELSYAELYVTDVLWPDFDEAEFLKALAAFGSRQRRFGEVKP